MKDYSNYHNCNIKGKIRKDALYILQRTLDGYAGYDVKINDVKDVKVLIYQKNDSNGQVYKVVGYPEDVERGNLVYYNNEIWLITTKPENNRVYHKAEMTFCPTFFPITSEDTKVLIGYDKLKRPVYEVQKGITVEVPCVVKFRDVTTGVADVNEPINLLHNPVIVTIPFRESPSINYNKRFKLYDDIYRIIKIDKSNSVNGVGILHITAERVDSADNGEGDDNGSEE